MIPDYTFFGNEIEKVLDGKTYAYDYKILDHTSGSYILKFRFLSSSAPFRESLDLTLCNYQGYRKCELILVFDAYKIKGHVREVEKFNNITIVYTKEAETADMYIERASYKLAKNNRVRVVTSDGMEQLIILGNGAIRVSAREFREEIDAAEKEIRAIIDGDTPR